MITTLMNQIQGFNRCSKLSDDGDPWAPINLLKSGVKEKHNLNPGGPCNMVILFQFHWTGKNMHKSGVKLISNVFISVSK